LSFLLVVSNGDSGEVGGLTTQTLFLVLTGASFSSLLFSFSSSISEDSAWLVAGLSKFESLLGIVFSSSLFSFSALIGTLFSVLTGVSSSWLLVLSGTAVGISLFSCSGSLSSFPLLIVLSSTVEDSVCSSIGSSVGSSVGSSDGSSDGSSVGSLDGSSDGSSDGSLVLTIGVSTFSVGSSFSSDSSLFWVGTFEEVSLLSSFESSALSSFGRTVSTSSAEFSASSLVFIAGILLFETSSLLNLYFK